MADTRSNVSIRSSEKTTSNNHLLLPPQECEDHVHRPEHVLEAAIQQCPVITSGAGHCEEKFSLQLYTKKTSIQFFIKMNLFQKPFPDRMTLEHRQIYLVKSVRSLEDY